MTDLRTAALRALEALEAWEDAAPSQWTTRDEKTITALRAALAQPEDKSQAAFEHWVETVEATQGCAISRNAVADAGSIIQPEIKADKPFGYFRAEPFGWTDCAPTDEGAIPLYTKVDSQGIAKQIPPEAQTEAEKIAYCAGWWAAMEAKREQPARPLCKGIPRRGCNYLNPCDTVCNKCGEIHHHHQMVAQFEAAQQPEIKADKEARWLPMPWKGLTEEELNYYKALGFVGVKAVEEKLRARNSTLACHQGEEGK